jgi:hypothetical protein
MNNGDFGRNENRGYDGPRYDIPRISVSGFYPEALDCFNDDESVTVGERSTRFSCFLRDEGGRLTARLRSSGKPPKAPDFKIMAGEEFYPYAQAAQLVVSPWGKTLTREMKITVLRNNRGQARYPGLRYMVVVKCHGKDRRFRMWNIGFNDGTRNHDSIVLRSELMELTMPGILQDRFDGKNEPKFTLEEVEEAIEQHLAAMVDTAQKNGDQKTISQAVRTQEKATPFIRAMAVSFLMAIGAEISMQDVPARENTLVAETATQITEAETTEPVTEKTLEPETTEPVAPVIDIADIQAKMSSRNKQDSRRRRPHDSKKKTGTDHQ